MIPATQEVEDRCQRLSFLHEYIISLRLPV